MEMSRCRQPPVWSLYIFMLIGRRTSFAERPSQKGPWPGRAAMRWLAAAPGLGMVTLLALIGWQLVRWR